VTKGGAPAPKKPGEAPPQKGTGKTKKISSGTPKPTSSPEGEKAKAGTGKVKKPLGNKSDSAGKPRRAPGPPPGPPATRGALDYLLGILAPVACAGSGAYAFLLLKGALGTCAANPILIEKFGDPAAAITKALDNGWAIAFPPAPIIAGGVVGLLATLCFLKMAPGIGARLMGGGMFAFGFLATVPFVLTGQAFQSAIKGELKKAYAVPRGADVDPQALTLANVPDFPKRKLLSVWSVDLDDGDIPLPWIAAAHDEGLPTGDKVPPDEDKIKFADLRIALISGRELAEKKQVDEDLWKKIQDLRDKANKEIDATSAEAEEIRKNWDKFEGRAKGQLAKPPAPKFPWFQRFTLNGDGARTGTPADDRAWYQKYYLGKAVHKAVKELPAEMKYAGCFRCEVNPESPVEPLTRFDFVWLCYDLEKADREPVLVPHIKGLLDEARFRIEVLGQKQ
jgi:hypothetical protein